MATIIDAHAHISTNHPVDELLKSMDKSGIEQACVFASTLFSVSNAQLLEAIKPHRDRLFPVAYVDVNSKYPFDHHISDILDQVVAAKFYTGYEHYYANSDKALKMCELLQKANIPAIYHMGDCLASCKHAKVQFAHPLCLDDVAVNFPDLKIVIAHMGWPFIRDAAYLCWKHKNVYADVSGMTYGIFDNRSTYQFRQALHEFLDIAEDDKLLFGTDFPVADQK